MRLIYLWKLTLNARIKGSRENTNGKCARNATTATNCTDQSVANMQKICEWLCWCGRHLNGGNSDSGKLPIKWISSLNLLTQRVCECERERWAPMHQWNQWTAIITWLPNCPAIVSLTATVGKQTGRQTVGTKAKHKWGKW